jgi:hypothetical protein
MSLKHLFSDKNHGCLNIKAKMNNFKTLISLITVYFYEGITVLGDLRFLSLIKLSGMIRFTG